jgi:hypothetical protein
VPTLLSGVPIDSAHSPGVFKLAVFILATEIPLKKIHFGFRRGKFFRKTGVYTE